MKKWISKSLLIATFICSLGFQSAIPAKAMAESMSPQDLIALNRLLNESMMFKEKCLEPLVRQAAGKGSRLVGRLKILFDYGFNRVKGGVTPANASDFATLVGYLRAITLTAVTKDPHYFHEVFKTNVPLGREDVDINLPGPCGNIVTTLLTLTAASNIMSNLPSNVFPPLLPEHVPVLQEMAATSLTEAAATGGMICRPIQFLTMTREQMETIAATSLLAVTAAAAQYLLSGLAATAEAGAAACGMFPIVPSEKLHELIPSPGSDYSCVRKPVSEKGITCEVVGKSQVECDIPSIGSVDFDCSRG